MKTEAKRYKDIAEKCLAFFNDPNCPDEAADIFMAHYNRAIRAMEIAEICPVAADRIFNNIQH